MKAAIYRALAIAPLVFVCGAYGQHQTFTIDPGASHVAFALNGNAHHVNGAFHVQSGSIDFDRSAQTISGSVLVAAESGNSGEKTRDKKMKTEVLDVTHYAEISFWPKAYKGDLAPDGDSSIEVSGIFNLHGASHNLTVPMQIHIEGGAITAKGHLTIPYVKWGLKDPSIFILKVAKEVDIDLTLRGNVTSANQAGTRDIK